MDGETRDGAKAPHVAAVPADGIEDLLKAARAAYDEDDSAAVARCCDEIVAADPDNAGAWGLLARFGGWDSKMYELDVEAALSAARRALDLVPAGMRYAEASEIYTARKKQIAAQLEAEMMMPSFTGAKQLHETMLRWKRLLEGIPHLPPDLIEGEISLCDNLCTRSKLGIMPGDRLVYTAYCSFNGKESYGDTFRHALAGRVGAEKRRRDEALARARQLAEDAAGEPPGEAAGDAAVDAAPGERERLEDRLGSLISALEAVEGFSGGTFYRQQVEELERQRAGLKPYKVLKRREIDGQLEALCARLAQIDAELEQVAGPLRRRIDVTRAQLAGPAGQEDA